MNKIEPPELGPGPDREKIPKTLDEALTALEKDEVMVKALGILYSLSCDFNIYLTGQHLNLLLFAYH